MLLSTAAYSSASNTQRCLHHRGSSLLSWKGHQISVQEETQQEIVDVIQPLRASHVQHQDSCFGFATEAREISNQMWGHISSPAAVTAARSLSTQKLSAGPVCLAWVFLSLPNRWFRWHRELCPPPGKAKVLQEGTERSPGLPQCFGISASIPFLLECVSKAAG